MVGLFHQRLRRRLLDARERYLHLDVETEAALRARADAHGGGDSRVVRDLGPALRGHELHGAEEAGGIAGGEQLFGIIATAATAAQLLGRGEIDGEGAVLGGGAAVTAAGSAGGRAILYVNGHGSSRVACRSEPT